MIKRHGNALQNLNAPARPDDSDRKRGYANGDVDCIGWQDRIDICVCMVRNLMQPEKCTGCQVNEK